MPAPTQARVKSRDDGLTEITWDALADFESGVQAFLIERDGKPLAQVPEKPAGKFGRALFQTMSCHDTPEVPLPEMRFLDTTATKGAKHEYRVITVNGAGLKSAATSAR